VNPSLGPEGGNDLLEAASGSVDLDILTTELGGSGEASRASAIIAVAISRSSATTVTVVVPVFLREAIWLLPEYCTALDGSQQNTDLIDIYSNIQPSSGCIFNAIAIPMNVCQ
jgi:hypothetical protein